MLSELFTMTCLYWVARHSKAQLIASLTYANPFVNGEAVIREGDPRRQKEKGRQRMRWLDSSTDAMDTNLSKL